MENRISNLFDTYVCRSSNDVIADSYYFIDLYDSKELEETSIFQTCAWFNEDYSGKINRSMEKFNESFYNLIEDAFPYWVAFKPSMGPSSAADHFRMFMINYLLSEEIGITDKLSKLNVILNHVRMVIDFKPELLKEYFDDFSEIHVSVIPTIHYHEEHDIINITTEARLYLKRKDLKRKDLKKTEIRFLGGAKTDSFASNRSTLIELLYSQYALGDSLIINLLFPSDFSCMDSLLMRKINNLREILKEYVS